MQTKIPRCRTGLTILICYFITKFTFKNFGGKKSTVQILNSGNFMEIDGKSKICPKLFFHFSTTVVIT